MNDEIESAEDTVIRNMLVESYVLSQKFDEDVEELEALGYERSAAEDMAIMSFEIEEDIL